MKTILIILVLVSAFLGGGCSRSDKEKQPDTVQTTANSNLRADAERLQKATAKAAEERRRAHESATPATPATPKP